MAVENLELETVALTDLDQTDLQFFNPSNRFDAEGLTKLIGEIEDRRKLRNDIEQDSMIRIRTRNLEAEKQALEDRDQKAEAEQQALRAETQAKKEGVLAVAHKNRALDQRYATGMFPVSRGSTSSSSFPSS